MLIATKTNSHRHYLRLVICKSCKAIVNALDGYSTNVEKLS